MKKRERKPFVWRGWAYGLPTDESIRVYRQGDIPGLRALGVRVEVREVQKPCGHLGLQTAVEGLRVCQECGSWRHGHGDGSGWSRWRKPRRG